MNATKQLREQIESLPEPHRSMLIPTIARVEEVQRRRQRIMDLLNEAMAQLRLDIKYLIFDIECTRKERDEAINSN